MKKVLLLILMSFSVIAGTIDSDKQRIKPDSDEDYVTLYLHDSGGKQHLKFKNNLSVFDNPDLKGDPTFVITPTEIISGSVHYSYKASFLGECDQNCKSYKFIPLDFIRIYARFVSLAVKDYKNDILRIEHNGKSYYLKFEPTNALEFKWRIYKNKDSVKKILESDPSYLAFVSEIKKCIKLKDLNCLSPYIDDHLTIEKIENNAKIRAVFDDEKFCKKFQDYRSSTKGVDVIEIPEEQLKEITNVNYVWNKISNALDLNQKKSVSVTLEDFGNKVRFVSSKNLDQETCDNSLDFRMDLMREKQKWKIIGFDLFSFNY